jgi:type I restriction enzyme M protein
MNNNYIYSIKLKFMSEAKTERIFERIVDINLTNDDLIIEYQTSNYESIRNLLKGASKTNKGGTGKPEHIIQHKLTPDLLIITEGKKNNLKHESNELNYPVEYAVDGVIHYSSFVSKEYDVISIAFSGDKESNLKISYFFQPKNCKIEKIETNVPLTIEELIQNYKKSEYKLSQDYDKLLKYLGELNNQLHGKKIMEMQRSFLISAVLIALDNKEFRDNFICYNENLPDLLIQSVDLILGKLKINDFQKQKLISHLNFIKDDGLFNYSILKDIIIGVEKNIKRYVETYKYNDILMDFHNQTLQYANNEKGLGIVLTPHHYTDFLCDILDVNENSILLDGCCGTAGFLISGLKKMRTQNPNKPLEEFSENFIGIEYQPHIWALSMFNFILHGVISPYIYSGDTFDEEIIKKVSKIKPDIGFLNPPYKSDKKNDREELEFVINQLEEMRSGGVVAAVLPMSSALNPNGKITELKKRLLSKHKLLACFSNPDELFYNTTATVVTCVMIFQAHIPHPKNYKTFFGYFKDDGFEKRKNKGRIDVNKKWEKIKEFWVSTYRNREEKLGISVFKEISFDDDWCAEAHLPTDISKLNNNIFSQRLRNYLSFLIKENHFDLFDNIAISSQLDEICISGVKSWKEFNLSDLFEINKGKRLTKFQMNPGNNYFISSSEFNNGLTGKISEEPIFSGNCLTVNYDGSVAESFYQPFNFWALDSVNVLYSKFELNTLRGIFISSIITNEKFRFNYGRKWTSGLMKKSKIFLPSTNGDVDFEFIDEFMNNLNYRKR